MYGIVIFDVFLIGSLSIDLLIWLEVCNMVIYFGEVVNFDFYLGDVDRLVDYYFGIVFIINFDLGIVVIEMGYLWNLLVVDIYLIGDFWFNNSVVKFKFYVRLFEEEGELDVLIMMDYLG